MPRLKCPRCATVVEVAPGATPQCPTCGFGSGTAASAPPSTPAPALAPTPAAASTSTPAPAPAAAFPPPASNPWTVNTAPAPMHRPGWVTFVGVYWFIAGGIALVAGLFLILAGTVMTAVFEEGVGEFGDLVGGFLAVIGVVALALGALGIVLGVFVMKGRNWARVVSLVLAILGIVFGVLGLVSSLALGDATSSPPGGGLIGIVLDILIVVALTRPESKAFFRVGAPPAAPM